MVAVETNKNAMSQSDDGDVIEEIVLSAGEVTEIVAGTYEQTIPQPELELEVSKGVDNGLIAYVERVEGRGDYTLIYHLDNANGTACRVTLWEHFA